MEKLVIKERTESNLTPLPQAACPFRWFVSFPISPLSAPIFWKDLSPLPLLRPAHWLHALSSVVSVAGLLVSLNPQAPLGSNSILFWSILLVNSVRRLLASQICEFFVV